MAFFYTLSGCQRPGLSRDTMGGFRADLARINAGRTRTPNSVPTRSYRATYIASLLPLAPPIAGNNPRGCCQLWGGDRPKPPTSLTLCRGAWGVGIAEAMRGRAGAREGGSASGAALERGRERRWGRGYGEGAGRIQTATTSTAHQTGHPRERRSFCCMAALCPARRSLLLAASPQARNAAERVSPARLCRDCSAVDAAERGAPAEPVRRPSGVQRAALNRRRPAMRRQPHVSAAARRPCVRQSAQPSPQKRRPLFYR